MEQSYRFCAGVRNDSDPTHSAIVFFLTTSRPSDLSSQNVLKCSINVLLDMKSNRCNVDMPASVL
jgi:hypothetical protein